MTKRRTVGRREERVTFTCLRESENIIEESNVESGYYQAKFVRLKPIDVAIICGAKKS
jgi:hypothetical protein